MSTHIIAIVGNPNCGKTTLFNALTGARQQVGNWPGVTVEKRSGHYQSGNKNVEVIDLPGTYCLDVVDSSVSLDEQIARNYILDHDAELIVNIIDASNIERNLYLTTQLMDMGQPIVVVLNMIDVAREKGVLIDIDKLSETLGCPVLPLTASRDSEAIKFKDQLNALLDLKVCPPRPISMGDDIERCIASLDPYLPLEIENSASRRWHSLKYLDEESSGLDLDNSRVSAEAERLRGLIETTSGEELDILMASARYDAIGNIVNSVLLKRGVVSHKLSERIDNFVLNRFLGLPFFFGVMYLMFMFSINIGSAFIDFFDLLTGTILVDGMGHLLTNLGAPLWLVTILANGIGGGIQTVSTFIPVIAFLFLFLSLLEDSGYMARAAFVVDRVMRVIGLPGKAFVPMLVGFGCNVPAIMATRTLDSEKDRLLTISMAPFMSCGARLPVYVLFGAAFFPQSGQNVVFGLYLAGILAAVFTGLVLKRSLLKGDSAPFIMELPNYHLPAPKQVLMRTWDRLKAFILRAGKAIALVVMVLNILNSIGTDGSFGHQDTEASLLSNIGQTITPLFSPMGMREDNWPAAVGIFTGILAKEAVVGTLDSMYSAIAASEEASGGLVKTEFNLISGIQSALATIPENLVAAFGSLSDPLGLNVGNLNDLESVAQDQEVTMNTFAIMTRLFPSDAAVIAYLLLILLYTPCVAALGAIYRETNLRWTFFVAGWTYLMGYSAATLYYQFSLITVHPLVTLSWVAIIALIMTIVFWIMKKAGTGRLKSSIPVTVMMDSQSSSGNKSCSC